MGTITVAWRGVDLTLDRLRHNGSDEQSGRYPQRQYILRVTSNRRQYRAQSAHSGAHCDIRRLQW
jgi:hypothetical protein